MSKLVVSSIIGLGGVTSVGGGIYLLHSNSKNPKKIASTEPERKTIQFKLQKEGFEILDINKSSHWSNLKNEYNKVKGVVEKIFNTSDKEINEEELKTLCKSALEKDENDPSYGKAKRWCVVPISITEHLGKLGFTTISTEKSGSTNQQQWTELASKYGSGENKIKDLNDLGSGNTWETLRNKCVDIGAKKNYEDYFDSYLLSSQNWCSAKNKD